MNEYKLYFSIYIMKWFVEVANQEYNGDLKLFKGKLNALLDRLVV